MFCPVCRSEYRDGFEVCKTCGDVPLVAELPKLEELRAEDLDKTRPVGLVSGTDVTRPVELGEDRVVDLFRVHMLARASELEQTLVQENIAAVIVPVPVDFPDDHQRFEVRVKLEDHEKAEAMLRDRFQGAVQQEETELEVNELDAEKCPACGAHVPLDVEECPECGLNVGGA